MEPLRQTKIIVTLGPATESPEKIRALIQGGANVFRLNMSHAKPDWCALMASRVRAAATELEKDVAILMDLQGPTIRTGELPKPLELEAGDLVEITLPGAKPALALSTSVNYPGLANDLRVGAIMQVDNGVLQFRVTAKDDERVTCVVVAGGTMGSRRHINLPGTRVNLPALTEHDLSHIELAVAIGVDFMAMSFVRDANHVRLLKGILAEKKLPAQVVAKIEDQQAVQNLDEIIEASDVIMVARGDLGIEVHLEELPIIQRRIVHRCVHMGRKVIVATHLLESMIENPVPTRAEVTDVANAVFEQADAVMLSGETSTGQFPVPSVEILDRICRRVEHSPSERSLADFGPRKNDRQKLVHSAVSLADSIPEAKLIVFTLRGIMAAEIAAMRPQRAPIFAFTPNLEAARSLHLSRSVHPLVLDFPRDNPSLAVEQAFQILRRLRFIREGDAVIIVSDVLQGEFVVNSISLRRL